jgi:hypothetical protein
MPVVVNYPPPSSVVVNEVTGAVTVVAAGPRGVQGVQGPAATVAVGTVATGAPGSDATVTNSGTSGAAVLDFAIPRGDVGQQGIQGEQGIQGVSGQWDTAQTVDDKTAAYTLLTADAGKLVTVSSSSNLDVTVDGSLDLSVGQRIDLLRLGTGEVTVVADNATVNGTPGLKLRARYSAATLLCVAADSYVLLGDLKA